MPYDRFPTYNFLPMKGTPQRTVALSHDPLWAVLSDGEIALYTRFFRFPQNFLNVDGFSFGSQSRRPKTAFFGRPAGNCPPPTGSRLKSQQSADGLPLSSAACGQRSADAHAANDMSYLPAPHSLRARHLARSRRALPNPLGLEDVRQLVSPVT